MFDHQLINFPTNLSQILTFADTVLLSLPSSGLLNKDQTADLLIFINKLPKDFVPSWLSKLKNKNITLYQSIQSLMELT